MSIIQKDIVLLETLELPPYSASDANKILKVDSNGIYLQWLQDTSELPIQTGNANKLLTTNGTTTSWTNDPSVNSVTSATNFKSTTGVANTNGYSFTGYESTGLFHDVSNGTLRLRYNNANILGCTNGAVNITQPVNLNNASQGPTNPQLVFNDTSSGSRSGFYGNPTDGNINCSTNDIERWKISTTAISHNLPTYITDSGSSAIAPSIKINNSASNTGLFSQAADRIQVSAGGLEYMRWSTSGVDVYQNTGMTIYNGGNLKFVTTGSVSGDGLNLGSYTTGNQVNINTNGNTRIGVNVDNTLIKNRLVLDNSGVANPQLCFGSAYTTTGLTGYNNDYIRVLVNGVIFCDFDAVNSSTKFTQNIRQTLCPVNDLYVLNSNGVTTVNNTNKPFSIIENSLSGTVTLNFGTSPANGLPDGWTFEALVIDKVGAPAQKVRFQFGNDVYVYHNGNETKNLGGGTFDAPFASLHKIFHRKGINSWYWFYY